MSPDFEMPDAFEWPPLPTMPATREDPVSEQVTTPRQFTPTLEWALDSAAKMAKPKPDFRARLEADRAKAYIVTCTTFEGVVGGMSGIILCYLELLEQGWPLIQAELDRLRARVAELEAPK